MKYISPFLLNLSFFPMLLPDDLQSFSLLKLHHFLLSSNAQLMDKSNPRSFFSFHPDVRHNMKERICRYFCFITALNYQHLCVKINLKTHTGIIGGQFIPFQTLTIHSGYLLHPNCILAAHISLDTVRHSELPKYNLDVRD